MNVGKEIYAGIQLENSGLLLSQLGRQVSKFQLKEALINPDFISPDRIQTQC